jgi:DNA-binding MarR family transcriptional regulator
MASAFRSPSVIHDPSSHTGYLAWQLGQATAQHLERALRPLEINLAQLRALVQASLTPGISSAEIARRAGLTAQTMGAAVNALVGRGLIERTAHPTNRRVLCLHVTDEGRRITERAQRLVDGVQDSMFGVLTPADQETVYRLLHQLVEHNAPDALPSHRAPAGRRSQTASGTA